MGNYCGQCGNKVDECICKVQSEPPKTSSNSLSINMIKDFFNFRFIIKKNWWFDFAQALKNIITNPVQTLISYKNNNVFANQIVLLYLLLIFSQQIFQLIPLLQNKYNNYLFISILNSIFFVITQLIVIFLYTFLLNIILNSLFKITTSKSNQYSIFFHSISLLIPFNIIILLLTVINIFQINTIFTLINFFKILNSITLIYTFSIATYTILKNAKVKTKTENEKIGIVLVILLLISACLLIIH